ncbi:Tetratricopeptide repeat protein 29, partial [Tetrabaena socialis]
MLYHDRKMYPEAVHYLRQFIELSAHMPDKAAVGTAYTVFSACLKEMGDREAAVRCLEEYLQLARGGDQHGTALASCALGIMLYEQADLDAAVSYFEKFFETARTLADRPMLEAARVNLGVARGAARMGAWMGVVAGNLPKLIAWKSSRVPFTDH